MSAPLAPVQARLIQSTSYHRISLQKTLILTFHPRLCLPSGSYVQVSPPKFRIIFSSPPCVPHASSILFSIISSPESLLRQTNYEPPHCAVFSSSPSPPPSSVHIYIYRPASWSSGQSLWLLIMRSRVRFPALPWEFSSKGKIPAVTMVWVD